MKIACIGDVGIDDYVNIGVKKPGGISFNFAINTQDNDMDCSFISAVGNDVEGNQLKKLLHDSNLDISHIKEINGITAKQNIELKENGERKFVGYSAGVLNKWNLNKSDLQFILKHNAVFVPFSDGLETVFKSIAKLQGTVIKIVDFSQDYEFVDFDSEENVITKYCTNFDIIFIGGNENLTTLIRKLNQQYPSKLFVLTVGNKGSFAFFQDKRYFQKATKVEKIVDTTGCGDAFQAAFVVTYLKEHNIQKALEAGAKQAASVITHIGSTKLNL